MNDEAVTHYQDTINQMTLGHKWLNKTFGRCGQPKVGWQIDTFGHSREFASTLSLMAFDGLFLGRVDYQDKTTRSKQKALEMVWKSNDQLVEPENLFTGILPNLYHPPKVFCYDHKCSDEILNETNRHDIIMSFVALIRAQADSYATNHTIVTMGNDFNFYNAQKWYVNLDRLINEVNSMSKEHGVHLVYSTPACYLKSLQSAHIQWPGNV